MVGAVTLTGWYVGFAIAAIIIAIVVVLVASILSLARRIAVQANLITQSLDQGRINTLPLWDVDKVNGGVRSIIKSAQTARGVLEGGKR